MSSISVPNARPVGSVRPSGIASFRSSFPSRLKDQRSASPPACGGGTRRQIRSPFAARVQVKWVGGMNFALSESSIGRVSSVSTASGDAPG